MNYSELNGGEILYQLDGVDIYQDHIYLYNDGYIIYKNNYYSVDDNGSLSLCDQNNIISYIAYANGVISYAYDNARGVFISLSTGSIKEYNYEYDIYKDVVSTLGFDEVAKNVAPFSRIDTGVMLLGSNSRILLIDLTDKIIIAQSIDSGFYVIRDNSVVEADLYDFQIGDTRYYIADDGIEFYQQKSTSKIFAFHLSKTLKVTNINEAFDHFSDESCREEFLCDDEIAYIGSSSVSIRTPNLSVDFVFHSPGVVSIYDSSTNIYNITELVHDSEYDILYYDKYEIYVYRKTGEITIWSPDRARYEELQDAKNIDLSLFM